MAALHLLATQDVSGALEVYQRAGLLREAALLGSLRFSPKEPRRDSLFAAWAQQLEATGLYEAAALASLKGTDVNCVTHSAPLGSL